MTDARVSQVAREVMRDASMPLRVGQFSREILRTQPAGTRIHIARMCREVLKAFIIPVVYLPELAFGASGSVGLTPALLLTTSLGFSGEGLLTLIGRRDPPFDCMETEPVDWTPAEDGSEPVWAASSGQVATFTSHSPAAPDWDRLTPSAPSWTRQD